MTVSHRYDVHRLCGGVLLGFGFALVFGLFSCQNPTYPDQPLSLEVEYVGLHRVMLSVHLSDSAAHRQIRLRRNDLTLWTRRMVGTDTLIVNTGLPLNNPFHYTTQSVYDGHVTNSSNTVDVQTLAPTSHTISWKIDTLYREDYWTSNCVNDVAILGPDYFMVVGAFQNHTDLPQNAAVWDGHHWEMQRWEVPYRGHPTYSRLTGIFAFSDTDMWSLNGYPLYRNGSNWKLYHLQELGVSDRATTVAWGSASDNMYFVGWNGGAVHYDGEQFQALPTHTTTSLMDVWGATLPSGKSMVLATASEHFTPGDDHRLYSLHPTSARDTLGSPLDRHVNSVWFDAPNGVVYTAGSGVYRRETSAWERQELPTYYFHCLRGSAPNNIVAVGGLGMVAHFNGQTWQTYPETMLNAGNWLRVAVTDHQILAGGFDGQRAVILRGEIQ